MMRKLIRLPEFDHFVINGDCRLILSRAEGVDFIFADPPFQISSKGGGTGWTGYNSSKGNWDYGISDYDKFTDEWIVGSYGCLREGGILAVKGVYGSLVPTYQSALKAGFNLLGHLIWEKSNPCPSVHRRWLTMSHEILLHFSKGRKWVFNYDVAKKLNGNKQMKNVWKFSGVKKKHSVTRTNPEVIKRHVLIFSNEGDLIVDPFLGSGTTLEICLETNRRCLGIEIDENTSRAVAGENGVRVFRMKH